MNYKLYLTKVTNNDNYIKAKNYIINKKNDAKSFYVKNKNDIIENPNILNPFKFPINNNKIQNNNYNIFFPHKFKVQKSTLIFYIIYFLVLFISIMKYSNLN